MFLAVVIIVIMAASSALMGGRANVISNVVGIVSLPAQKALTGFTGWVGSIYSYTYEYDALKAENESLKKQIAEMEKSVRQAQYDQEENERLRELLKLSQQRRDFVFESATIVSRSSSNWTASVTLSKGSAQGVKAGDSIVTETGVLVGVIVEVGTNWSTAITVTDPDTELGALIFRTGEAAIAEGDFELMGSGKLKLTYLPEDVRLLNGDLIVTSGRGGVLPSGLIIGTVDEVKTDVSGLTDYAVITPSVSADSLTQVFIIKSFDIVE